MRIDARGQGCPKPVMMAEEALAKMQEGSVEVLVDDETSAENIARFASKSGFFHELGREGRDWRVRIVKGYSCVASAPAPSEATEKHLMLIIGSDAFGKEEELGKMLVKGFFETMKVTKEIPHTMFFLNAGVKLTTTNEEVATVLKDLAGMGVEIYSCGTCLKYYGLEDSLKVGHRGSTNHVVEGLKDFARVVWI